MSTWRETTPDTVESVAVLVPSLRTAGSAIFSVSNSLLKGGFYLDTLFKSSSDFASLSLKDLIEARDLFHYHLMNKKNVVATALDLIGFARATTGRRGIARPRFEAPHTDSADTLQFRGPALFLALCLRLGFELGNRIRPGPERPVRCGAAGTVFAGRPHGSGLRDRGAQTALSPRTCRSGRRSHAPQPVRTRARRSSTRTPRHDPAGYRRLPGDATASAITC